MKEYTAGISITEACNQTCEHCYIGRKMYWHEKNYKFKSIPKDKFNLLVVQLVEANVTRVNFGGGESPLHPHFLTFAQKLYDAGIKTSLVTNGSNISMNKIRPNLSLFNDVGVSIDFSDERHSINRRKPDSFKSAVRSLKEIVESKKTKTEMVTCIMNINYSNLPQLYELAKSIGVDMWRLNRFHPTKNDLSRFSVEKLNYVGVISPIRIHKKNAPENYIIDEKLSIRLQNLRLDNIPILNRLSTYHLVLAKKR